MRFYKTLAICPQIASCVHSSCAVNHTLLHYAILAIVVSEQYHDELGITSPDTLSEFFHFWFSLHIASAFNFIPPETISITTFITRDTILMGQHVTRHCQLYYCEISCKVRVLQSHVEIKIIPLHISITLLRSKCLTAKLP